ncbi:hypothetical protein Dda_0400 [Drechslerella dactyloides]|uniref:Uncharacterized protein n=1 Tax=Drechslerella dactyloides TaxID=74499 RepID=A0AAD6J7U4_DREDA|nr:hypothetical protein Dda_0400 [Drechslerella dactyloides]
MPSRRQRADGNMYQTAGLGRGGTASETDRSRKSTGGHGDKVTGGEERRKTTMEKTKEAEVARLSGACRLLPASTSREERAKDSADSALGLVRSG